MSFTDILNLGALAPNFNSDSVAVFDSNFNQVFANARPMRGEITPRARLMDHPLENGQLTTDYKVILPLEIVMPMIVSAQYYRDTYQEIWGLWQTSELLTVQMRAASYGNMVIVEPPHEERPDMYDIITINLRFRQVQIVVSTSNFSPLDPTQVDTVSLGQQSSYPVAAAADPNSGVTPGPQVTGITAQSSQNFYSSVQQQQNPNSYTINGVQTSNGVVNLPATPPAQNIPVEGVQSLTSQDSISSAFTIPTLSTTGLLAP